MTLTPEQIGALPETTWEIALRCKRIQDTLPEPDMLMPADAYAAVLTGDVEWLLALLASQCERVKELENEVAEVNALENSMDAMETFCETCEARVPGPDEVVVKRANLEEWRSHSCFHDGRTFGWAKGSQCARCAEIITEMDDALKGEKQ